VLIFKKIILMKISIVINADTRPQRDTFGGSNLMGVCNADFLIDGVLNKQKFFEGFDTETIVFIDEHDLLDERTLMKLRIITDTLVIRKHTDWNLYNDDYYIQALELARGEYIFHFDQDTAAFTSAKETITYLLNLLEQYDYVSYPSHWSPIAVHDDSFDYVWASTRFFCCKRETLDFTEMRKWLGDYEYAYSKYPASRKCHWFEHCLGLLAKYNGKGVYYPPMEYDKYLIFCWGRYTNGLLNELNNSGYNSVLSFVLSRSGIQYPNDLYA